MLREINYPVFRKSKRKSITIDIDSSVVNVKVSEAPIFEDTDLRFVISSVLKSEKVVISHEKRGNSENYIKEAKYDMAVMHLLLKSFWANEAEFQIMSFPINWGDENASEYSVLRNHFQILLY